MNFELFVVKTGKNTNHKGHKGKRKEHKGEICNSTMNMTRIDFLKKLIQVMLASLLAFIALALVNRIITSKDCSSCSGNGICRGETDCNKFIAYNK